MISINLHICNIISPTKNIWHKLKDKQYVIDNINVVNDNDTRYFIWKITSNVLKDKCCDIKFVLLMPTAITMHHTLEYL